jgi:integrase
VWWLAYYVRGKEIRESTELRLDPKKPDHGKSQAEKLLDQRRGEVTTGHFIGPQQYRVTFEELTEAFTEDYRVRRLRSPVTADARVKHLQAFFGLDRALDITSKKISKYQQHRLAEQAQPATINRELAALRRMFSLAVKQGRLTMGLTPSFPDRLEEAPPRQGFFEHAEYEGIRKRLPADYCDVLDFGYLTGWRRREVTGLTWAEVDLAGGVIRLDPARSKSKTARLLPLSLPLREVIERRARRRKKGVSLVFHRNGLPVGDWRKSWDRACINAGLYVTIGQGKTAKRVPSKSFHDLRRTAARNYIRSGVPERVAMALLGHKTRAVFDRYNIVSEADLKQAAGKLAYYVSSASGR